MTMLYCEWAETFGQNRWIRSDGTPRTIYPLDYNWERIFNDACKQVDFYFHNRELPCDSMTFTTEFLSLVPEAWMKYKTQLEFFSGTLTGETINPEEFHAGRKHEMIRELTDDRNEKIGSRKDTQQSSTNVEESSGNKERSMRYEQGVQAVSPRNSNIGELGTDYLSEMNDGILNSERNGNTNGDTTVKTGAQKNETNTKVYEKITEDNEIVNYYDQLAFARSRMEMMDDFKSFYEYFQPLFFDVEGMIPWFKQGDFARPPFYPDPGIFIV